MAHDANTNADGTDGSYAREHGARIEFAGGDVELVRERTIAIAEGFGNGEVEWSFSWWAPDEPLAATLHIAMLDGDGASDSERRFIDPYHDDVATLRLAICPEGETCEAAPEPA